MTTPVVKLENLRLEEVSLVDDPAHAAGAGWMVQKARENTDRVMAIVTKAMKPMTDAELYEFVMAGLAKSNPGQHRDGRTGRFASHIEGLTNRHPVSPTSPALSGAPAAEPSSEPVQHSFFRPARDAYRRIF